MTKIKRDSPECQEILTKVLRILDLLELSIKKQRQKNPYRDAYSYIAVTARPRKKSMSVNKKCVNLTNQSICGRRYEEAVKLLWVLCQDCSVFDTYLYKATMLILENLKLHDASETMLEIAKALRKMDFINKKEMLLDYIIYGLKNNVPDLHSKLKGIALRKHSSCFRKNDTLDPIYDAYCGLIECTEGYRQNIDDVQASQDDVSQEDTILKFKALIETPGDWDIFVLKLVEILEHFERNEEVEEVLLKYAEQNPNNLNAQIYLCSYLSKNDPHSENLINHLKIISKLSPSDERVLDLLEKQSDDLLNSLELIFNFLDYPSNGKNIRAWDMFLRLISQVRSRRRLEELVTTKELWSSRSKSWYWLHFNPSQAQCLNESDVLLIVKKINVISHFEKDNIYCETVQRKFPSVSNFLQ